MLMNLFSKMRFIVMFVTAVCVLFLIKLRWPKKKSIYDTQLKTALIIIIIIINRWERCRPPDDKPMAKYSWAEIWNRGFYHRFPRPGHQDQLLAEQNTQRWHRPSVSDMWSISRNHWPLSWPKLHIYIGITKLPHAWTGTSVKNST